MTRMSTLKQSLKETLEKNEALKSTNEILKSENEALKLALLEIENVVAELKNEVKSELESFKSEILSRTDEIQLKTTLLESKVLKMEDQLQFKSIKRRKITAEEYHTYSNDLAPWENLVKMNSGNFTSTVIPCIQRTKDTFIEECLLYQPPFPEKPATPLYK